MAFTSAAEQLPSGFQDTTQNLLRPDQMSEYQRDIDSAKRQLDNPNVQDKGAVRKRLTEISRQYDAQAPRPITDGKLKDRLAAEAKQLLDEITPGMLSQEEMRKNPPRAVDRHMKWEAANKKKILRWKKIQLMLNADQSRPHTWDRDAANLEAYRPEGASNRVRLDAQIPGAMSYGNVPDENWKAAFGSTAPDNSALNQAIRVAEEVEKTADAPSAKKGK